MKFHNGKEIPYGPPSSSESWKTGDTLGCWCRFDGDKDHTIEIGYTLNGNDLGVAFCLSATRVEDLGRYFPAVSLNLGEVVDLQFGSSSTVNTELVNVSSLIVCSSSEELKPKADDVVKEESDSPPKKKPREDEEQKATKPPHQEEDVEIEEPFDLNSCKSVDELLNMDHTRLKKILLSMGVKCG